MKLLPALALALGLGFAVTAADVHAEDVVPAADKAAYKATLQEVIKEAASGKVADVDAAVAKLNKVVETGAGWCKTHAAKDAKNQKALEFVAASVDKMKAETLESIEANWHQGKAMKDAGAGDYATIDQTSAAASLLDTVIHPVTAIIALNEYKKDQKKDHLDQVVSELEELVGHLDHI